MNMYKMIYWHFRNKEDKEKAKELNSAIEIPFDARIEAVYSNSGNLKALNVYKIGSHSLYARMELLPGIKLNYYNRGKIVKVDHKLFYVDMNDHPEGLDDSYVVTEYKGKYIMRKYQ